MFIFMLQKNGLIFHHILRFLSHSTLITTILPTSEDFMTLKQNLAILFARTIHENIPFFGKDFQGLICQHIPLRYSDNRSTKS